MNSNQRLMEAVKLLPTKSAKTCLKRTWAAITGPKSISIVPTNAGALIIISAKGFTTQFNTHQ